MFDQDNVPWGVNHLYKRKKLVELLNSYRRAATASSRCLPFERNDRPEWNGPTSNGAAKFLREACGEYVMTNGGRIAR